MWVPLSRIFWEHEKSVRLKHYPAYYIKLYRKKETKFLEKKIWAKQESSLTAVQLKRDPPVLIVMKVK